MAPSTQVLNEILINRFHMLPNCELKLDYLNKSRAIMNVDTVNTVTKDLSRVFSQCMRRV